MIILRSAIYSATTTTWLSFGISSIDMIQTCIKFAEPLGYVRGWGRHPHPHLMHGGGARFFCVYNQNALLSVPIKPLTGCIFDLFLTKTKTKTKTIWALVQVAMPDDEVAGVR